MTLRRFFRGWVTRYPLLLFFLALSLLPGQSQAIEPLEGWPATVPNGQIIFSSANIADIDGNSENGNEVVVSTANGYVYAFNANGTLLWQAATPIVNCSGNGETNKLLSSPAVGLLKQGLAVVIGYGGIGGSCAGGVVSFDAATGTQIANFNVEKKAPSFERLSAVVGTPALGDIDGDGTTEIAFGAHSREGYLLRSNGKKEIYSFTTADTVWCSAALARFTGDSFVSFLIGTDISRNDALIPPTPDGGYFYKLRTSFGGSGGVKRDCSAIKNRRRRRRCRRRQKRNTVITARAKPKHFGFRDSGVVVWYREYNQTIFSSPVVADLISSSPGREIAFGTGPYFPEGSGNKRGKQLNIVSKDGKQLRTLSAPGVNESSVAVGDLDGDGDYELIGTFNAAGHADDRGYIVAWDPETGDELWRTAPTNSGNDENGSFKYSPVTADLDGNGTEEVVVANNGAIGVYDGTTGALLTCSGTSCSNGNAKIKVGKTGKNTPAIGDVDGDGTLEIVYGSGTKVHVLTNTETVEGSQEGTLTPFTSTTSMWRVNSARTGEVP